MQESKASMYEEVFVNLTKAVAKVGGGGGADKLQQTWVPAIRMDLTRCLNSASDVMLDEFRYAMATEYGKDARGGDPTQWTTTTIHLSINDKGHRSGEISHLRWTSTQSDAGMAAECHWLHF